MSDDNTLASKFGQTRQQALIVEVEFHAFVEEIRLAHEQVCRPRCLEETLRPCGIPGVYDDSPSELQTEGVRRCTTEVSNRKTRDAELTNPPRFSFGQLDKLDVEFLLYL